MRTLALLMLTTTAAFAADGDSDGMDDAVDDCPGLATPDQADVNADGWGDACVGQCACVR